LGFVFACWFWFFAVFWSTACDGQHQNPSGVTAMGTFLIFVVRASPLATFDSAMLPSEDYDQFCYQLIDLSSDARELN